MFVWKVVNFDFRLVDFSLFKITISPVSLLPVIVPHVLVIYTSSASPKGDVITKYGQDINGNSKGRISTSSIQLMWLLATSYEEKINLGRVSTEYEAPMVERLEVAVTLCVYNLISQAGVTHFLFVVACL